MQGMINRRPFPRPVFLLSEYYLPVYMKIIHSSYLFSIIG